MTTLLPTPVPGTTVHGPGGTRSVVMDGHPERVVFHPSRARKPWRCAVTGEVIEKGEPMLMPGPRALLAFGPFRLSLEGWARLEHE